MRTISTFIQRALLTATALCVAATATMAQVSSYNFSQLSGTYTAITGGTVIGLTTSDDNNYANELAPTTTSATGIGFPIGFNFTFNGFVFDRFALNTNGFITLGQSALTPSTSITSSYTSIAATTTTTPPQLANRIAGFNRDLQGQTGSSMSYLTIGTAPNRICVIQWSGFKRFGTTGTGDNLNFQIRLYETTNVVETTYGNFVITNATSSTVQVGLRGVTNADFNNRSVVSGTNTWATSIAGALNSATLAVSSTLFPASGQTYRWTPANCLAPAGLAVSNIVATSADATWTTNTASGQLVIVPQGNAANTGTPVAISGTSLSLPSLTPNTNYSVFVRTICGVGDTSNWSTPVNFLTPCLATNVPWTESFEGVVVTGTGGPLPSCWTRNVTDFATGNGAQSSNRSARTGTKYLYTSWSTVAGTGDWAFTPGFNLTAGVSYDFSFWYKSDGLTGWDTLRAGVGTQPLAANMTIFANRVYNITNTGYAEYRVSFVPATTGVYYFGTNVWAIVNPNNITFDDYNIDFSPTCPQPSALNATAVTNTTATVNWTGNGQPDNYYYYFAPAPAPLPAGTVGTFANTTSFNATGLTGNTSYSFYVRQYCSVGDTSAWTGPFTFTTSCDPITLGDTRANPFIVTGLNYTATGNTNSPCYTNTIGNTAKDVWYRVVLDPCATTISASLCTGTSFDSYLRLYADDGTTQLAFNDDGCGTQSVITNFNIAGRDTVYVLVEGFGSAVGAYTVNITQAVAPTPNADVTYSTLYCNNAANPTPTINGTTGGVFSSLTTGIALDTMTGTINIATSTLNTYDIVYTVLGTTPTCFDRDTNTVQIAPLETAAFAYANTAYCNTAANPSPSITGTTGGIFTASSANLVLDASSGAIDLAGSQTGTYDVTYTTTGACFAALTRSVTLVAPQDPAFDYGVGTYCQNVGNPMPTNVATAGGVYTAPAGLAINPNTGLIILSASATGSYMVTYTTPNACAAAQTQTFVINPADDASFTFGANVFCQNVPTQQAVVTGVPFGTFSSGTGLPVDITFGLVDFSTGTTGTHTVIYATNGACPNFSVQTLLVLPADTAEFAYQGVTYCLTALSSQETPTITGNTGGTFFSTSGIDLNPTTGVINLGAANSQVGTYTVSYVTNGPTTCRDTATATIVLEDCTTIGVSEYNSNSQESYNLYPNPNDGGFYLHNKGEFKTAQIELIDMLGRVVYSQAAAALPADAAIRIETQMLPAATYYLRITADNMQPTVLPVRIVQP